MSFSINTNASAFVALQNLTSTNKGLATVQNRINTGLAVSSTRDNSAVFAIAQNLRADLGGLKAVNQSIDRGNSTLDVGINAAESISDVLIQLKEKAVAASDTSLDDDSRKALAADFDSLVSQIDTIVSSAAFNGTNIVDGAVGASGTVSGVDSLSVLLSPDDNTQTLDVAGVGLGAAALGLASGDITTGSTDLATDASSAAAAATAIDAAIQSVNDALSAFGSASRTLSTQKDFFNKLSDTISTGIGNLVDADLARESANLQSLQVKQQLGLQALSIANQSPQAVLSLFRDRKSVV